MTDLSELIKALENADRGSRELDRAIAAALAEAAAPRPEPEPGPEPPYTTSLDASLSLLPEAGYWELMCISNDGFTQYACEVHPVRGRAPVIGVGKQAPLAVGAAALRARDEAGR